MGMLYSPLAVPAKFFESKAIATDVQHAVAVGTHNREIRQGRFNWTIAIGLLGRTTVLRIREPLHVNIAAARGAEGLGNFFEANRRRLLCRPG